MSGWLDAMLSPLRVAGVTWANGDDRWYATQIMQPTASRVNVTDESAMTYSAVWAATRLLSSSMAGLPLNLIRRTRGKTEIAYDDPRRALVHRSPNPANTAFTWRAWSMAMQLNQGNAFAEIERSSSGVRLWPIDSTRVKVHVWNAESRERLLQRGMPLHGDEHDGVPYYEISNGKGEPTFLPASRMLHVPSMMLKSDGVTGKGVIQHARESIGMGIATERFGANHFGANGVPRIAITQTPDIVSFQDGAEEQFRKQWDALYGSPTGRKSALLPPGMNVTPIPVSPDDSQFLETRQFNVEEICRWYGVPPHMLHHLIRATHNNIEHGQIEFVMFSLLPWLILWEQELNRKLLTPDEQETMFFKFAIEGLKRGDSTAQANYFGKMVNSAIMNPNEVRELLDLNEYEGGDKFYIQGAMVPTEMAGMFLKQGKQPGDSANDDMSSRVQVAARTAIGGILRRLSTKAVKAMDTAARHPSEYMQRVEDFYGHQEGLLRDAMAEYSELWTAAGVAPGMVSGFPSWHCAKQRETMIEVAGQSSVVQLAGNVARRAAAWLSEDLEADVNHFMGGA